MTKNVMISTLILISISFMSCTSSRNCGPKKTVNHIWFGKAFFRTSRYKHKKLKDLELAKTDRREEKKYEISYNAKPFDKLLASITTYTPENGRACDGMRVYFAQYPLTPQASDSPYLIPVNAKGRMTLIFVPTLQDREYIDSETGKHNYIHIDDSTSYFIIKDDSLYTFNGADKPNTAFLSNWINEYLSSRLNKFEKAGVRRTGDSKYAESRSIWYSKVSLEHHDDPDSSGLIDYLHYFECKYNVNSVSPKFASYLGRRNKKRPWAYQLTLVYNFKGRNKKRNLHLFRYNVGLSSSGNVAEVYGSGNTDTGVPCPPVPQGETKCPGSLPQ